MAHCPVGCLGDAVNKPNRWPVASATRWCTLRISTTWTHRVCSCCSAWLGYCLLFDMSGYRLPVSVRVPVNIYIFFFCFCFVLFCFEMPKCCYKYNKIFFIWRVWYIQNSILKNYTTCKCISRYVRQWIWHPNQFIAGGKKTFKHKK